MNSTSEIDIDTAPAVVQRVRLPSFEAAAINVFLKREDRLGVHLTGNKWRKLKFNLREARAQDEDTLLTFGGPFSNQIRAVASAGRRFGFRTIGVIRGEERRPLNRVLEYAEASGMRLHWIDRGTYRTRKTESAFLSELAIRFGKFYLLPEGGTNRLSLRGCAEMVGEINVPFDIIVCPCGTGGTLAGILTALKPGTEAIGIAVLKGGDFLAGDIRDLAGPPSSVVPWRIETGFHCGGYAKRPATFSSSCNRSPPQPGSSSIRFTQAK